MSLHWTNEQRANVERLLLAGHTSTEVSRMTGYRRESVRKMAIRLSEQGKLGTKPVLEGFALKKITTQLDANGALKGEYIQQGKAAGEIFEKPDTHTLAKITVQRDPEGRIIQDWTRFEPNRDAQAQAFRAAVEALKESLPRADPILAPRHCMSSMLSQYTITDSHLGAMAWNVETGRGDYDLSIGEKLLVDWFAAAIASSPSSGRAVFAQLGDFLHYDSFKSITPEHGHLLDADSRYPKMVRVAIRVVRQVIRMLLEKHEHVHVIMADANHDPVGEVWLREMLAVLYENEPRITVDTDPGTYNLVEHGDVSLFYHHGHRRGMKNLDSMMAGRFRQAYGRTRFSYCHTGHKHANELKRTDLMEVEMHETLAAPDAYGSNWLSGRSAKRIDYHEKRGEVGRNIITAEMVADGAIS